MRVQNIAGTDIALFGCHQCIYHQIIIFVNEKEPRFYTLKNSFQLQL